jgi:Fic family protein
MDIFARYKDEQHPVYQRLESANLSRYYGFLTSMIESALDSNQCWLTEEMIRAINFHAIVGLYPEAGQYRNVPVVVGNYNPPHHTLVESLMRRGIEIINSSWDNAGSTALAARALWWVNYVHPFVNGNGRTARAVCYFILCVKSGGLLPGTTILPEMLRTAPTRARYVAALKQSDAGNHDDLVSLINELVKQQIQART